MQSVYGLVDPRTKEVRYIGKASDVHRRYAQHLLYDKTNTAKAKWLTDLKKDGLLPSLIILESSIPDSTAHDRERYWIQHHLSQGASLTNIMCAAKPVKSNPVPEAKPRPTERTYIWIKDGDPLPEVGDEVIQTWEKGTFHMKIHHIVRVYNCLDKSKQMLVDVTIRRAPDEKGERFARRIREINQRIVPGWTL